MLLKKSECTFNDTWDEFFHKIILNIDILKHFKQLFEFFKNNLKSHHIFNEILISF